MDNEINNFGKSKRFRIFALIVSLLGGILTYSTFNQEKTEFEETMDLFLESQNQLQKRKEENTYKVLEDKN